LLPVRAATLQTFATCPVVTTFFIAATPIRDSRRSLPAADAGTPRGAGGPCRRTFRGPRRLRDDRQRRPCPGWRPEGHGWGARAGGGGPRGPGPPPWRAGGWGAGPWAGPLPRGPKWSRPPPPPTLDKGPRPRRLCHVSLFC